MSTMVVNTHEAKSRLSELIRAVDAGDEVIVAGNGTPVARLVAWDATDPATSSGCMGGAGGLGR